MRKLKEILKRIKSWAGSQEKINWIRIAGVLIWTVFVIAIITDAPRWREKELQEANRRLIQERDLIQKKKDSLEILVAELRKIKTNQNEINQKYRALRSAPISNPAGDSIAREILKKAALQGLN